MARNTDTIDYTKDYYTGFAAIYFNKILKTIIKFGNLNKEPGLVLDFGSGSGHLKKLLPQTNVVNYDIIPELSDIQDYRSLKPKKIILSGVLEHLYLSEISRLLDEFISMNSGAELLVYLPTENWASKIAMRLAGQKNAHDDHVSKYQEINQILDKKYFLKKRTYIFARMAQISHYAKK